MAVGRWALAMGVAAAVVVWSAAQPAWAHDEPVSFSPAEGSAVSVDPGRVAVAFEEPPGAGPFSLIVTDASGRTAETGDVSIAGSVMSVPVRLVRAGGYAVRFEIVSDDGHPVTGAFGFTFRPGPTPARTEASFVETGRGSVTASESWWVPWSAVGTLVITCVTTWRARRRLKRLTTVGNS